MAPPLPTLEEAHATHIHTKRHIPKSARGPWGGACADSVTLVCDRVTSGLDATEACSALFIMPRVTLPAAPKGRGAGAAQNQAADTKDRLRRWRAGEGGQMWTDLTTQPRGGARAGRRKKQADPTQPERNVARASTLAQEGQYTRALQALLSQGMDQVSGQAIQAMESKHPRPASPPTLPPEPNGTPPLIVSSAQVRDAIFSFHPGTAPGPSGLRAEHLKEALSSRAHGQAARLLVALTRLVNLMLAGKLPTLVAPFLNGGNLFAAVKKDGGFRPIVVRDVLVRATSKCATKAVAARAEAYLAPLQLGVGVRGGCEATVHATRHILQDTTIHHSDKWLLQVDFSNAYNSVDRTAMFAAVRDKFPDLSHWIEWSYSQPSHLNFGKGVIWSAQGCQQGDPASGLAFSLTLQPLIKKLGDIQPP